MVSTRVKLRCVLVFLWNLLSETFNFPQSCHKKDWSNKAIYYLFKYYKIYYIIYVSKPFTWWQSIKSIYKLKFETPSQNYIIFRIRKIGSYKDGYFVVLLLSLGNVWLWQRNRDPFIDEEEGIVKSGQSPPDTNEECIAILDIDLFGVGP